MIQEMPPEGLKKSPIHIQRYNQIEILASAPQTRKDHHDTKAGKKNPTDITSYRPISLLPVTSKILEKLLLKRIYNDTQFQEWIPLHQIGFRKAHSTIQQCHSFTDIINKTFDDQQYCSAFFLGRQPSFR